MNKFFISLACCLCLSLLPAASPAISAPQKVPVSLAPAKPSPTEAEKKKAALESLALANLYLEIGEYADAKKLAEDVFKSFESVSGLRTEAGELLKKIQEAGQAKYHKLLNEAKEQIISGNYDSAEKKIQEVIKQVPAGSNLYKEALEKWNEILQKKDDLKNQQDLFAVQNKVAALIKNGDFDKATKEIEGIITNSKNPIVVKEARNKWREASLWGNWLFGKLNKIWEDLWSYFKWPIYLVLLFPLFLLLRKGYQYLFTRRKLQFKDLSTDEKGMVALFMAGLDKWKGEGEQTTHTSGLLRMEVPRAMSSFILSSKEKFLKSFETLPTIQTVNLGEIAKSLNGISSWFGLCPPWISFRFSKDAAGQKLLSCHVTIQRKQDRVELVYPLKEMKPEEEIEGIKNIADSLAYQTLYLLARQDASVAEAEAADKLRQGMTGLNNYLTGGDFSQLVKSLEMFREARKDRPCLLEAFLYEGITLDLQEDHDESARVLKIVKDESEEKRQQLQASLDKRWFKRFRKEEKRKIEAQELLGLRAAYNEAVAHLRNYTLEEINTSIEFLDKLKKETAAGYNPTSPAKRVIGALTQSTQALAIAHKPLFWDEAISEEFTVKITEDKLKYPGKVLDHKKQRKNQILQWREEINTHKKQLENLLTNPAIWGEGDPLDRRRLKWAIHNFWGQFHLNCAVDFLAGVNSEFVEKDNRFTQQDYLNIARDEFVLCELLLPPGVETLGDLGTVFLYLGDLPKAAGYLEKATKSNPHYEYAFYRLAEVRATDDEKTEVLRSLAAQNRPVYIKAFQQMYEKYKIKYIEGR